MSNPILQMLTNNRQLPQGSSNPSPQMQQPMNLNNIKNMINMIKKSNNPQNIFNFLIENNPKLKQVMKMVESCNSPKEAFLQYAKQQNIDPNVILNMLK